MARLKLGVQISGRGSNLQALIDACKNPDFPAEIVLVISNIAGVQGLERAEKASIPTVVIPHKDYPSREAFDEALDAAHRKAGVELVCLAGFMRIITGWFVSRWAGKMINIHPSLLPAYPGLHTHRRALEDKVQKAGCTVHFVEEGMDTGPIILQTEVPVQPGDTEESLAIRVLKEEHQIYPEAVRMIATGEVRYESGKAVRAIKAALLLLALIPLFGAPAFAEVVPADEMRTRQAMGILPAWTVCGISEDCVAVDLSCGPTLGIRKEYKIQAEAAICKVTKNCPVACDSSAVTTPFTLCKDGECWADYRR